MTGFLLIILFFCVPIAAGIWILAAFLQYHFCDKNDTERLLSCKRFLRIALIVGGIVLAAFVVLMIYIGIGIAHM